LGVLEQGHLLPLRSRSPAAERAARQRRGVQGTARGRPGHDHEYGTTSTGRRVVEAVSSGSRSPTYIEAHAPARSHDEHDAPNERRAAREFDADPRARRRTAGGMATTSNGPRRPDLMGRSGTSCTRRRATTCAQGMLSAAACSKAVAYPRGLDGGFFFPTRVPQQHRPSCAYRRTSKRRPPELSATPTKGRRGGIQREVTER